MTTPAPTRLAAPGVPLDLTDGRTVHVRFGMRALMRLEDRFGSLQGVARVFQAAQSGEGTAVVGSAVAILACGLQGEHDGSGAPLTDPERLADLLDPLRLQDYVTAAGEALTQAFPVQAAPGNDGAPAAPDGSPGTSGTTPAP